jgi:hypothetical protein
VEAQIPHMYEWSGYSDLFGIIKEFKLKVQVRNTFLSLQSIVITGSVVYSDTSSTQVSEQSIQILFNMRVIVPLPACGCCPSFYK